jgi:hypothetical protein
MMTHIGIRGNGFTLLVDDLLGIYSVNRRDLLENEAVGAKLLPVLKWATD